MKKINKTIMVITMGLCIMAKTSLAVPNNIENKYKKNDVTKCTKIPDKMNSGTIIKYISDLEYEILYQGIKSGKNTTLMDNVNVTNELNNLFVGRLNNEEPLFTDNLTLVKGIEVIYADDGLIYDIKYPKGIKNPLLVEKQKKIAHEYISTYGDIIVPGVTFIARWGASNNKLFVDDNESEIFGIGRATTFEDKIGQRNIVLAKGDVATKMAYDNCKIGLPVEISSVGENSDEIRVNLYKRDVGGMPDAIIDIWKNGVEYWGYSYDENFSLPHTTMITHKNINEYGNPLY